MPLGHSQSDWDAAKSEVLAILRERARACDPITYSELAPMIQAISFQHERHDFHECLGAVAEDENAEGRGLISVLVIYKNERVPGPGFFKLCRKHGRTEPDQLGLWMAELNRVVQANGGRCR